MLITPPVVTITIGAVAYISWRMNLPWNNDQILAISLLFAASLRISANVDAGFSVNVDGVSAGSWTIPEARE